MSCPNGYSNESYTDSIAVELIGRTTFGATAYRWKHEITWQYSYCTEDGGLGLVNASIDSVDQDVRNLFTDFSVSYEGVVESDDDRITNNDGSLEQLTAYRQAKYSSDLPLVGDSVIHYPTSEIRVREMGGSDVITAKIK